MTHLTSDELVDAVEGMLDSRRLDHLGGCNVCAAELAQLRLVLDRTRQIAVPEPSPLFWDRFSARVSAAIDAELSTPPRRAAAWFRLPVLAPLGALALLVVALAATIPRTASPVVQEASRTAAAAAENDLPQTGEQEWAVLSAIIGSVPLDQAPDAGIIVRPGDAERAAMELNAAEQHELVRLLKAEIERSGG